MKIEVQPVSFEDKTLLRNLLQLYLYDLSEYEAIELNDHGEFGYNYLDPYWTDSNRHPFLVRIDGRIGGFVLVNAFTYTEHTDHSLAELFILRKYRKAGIGRRAVFEVLDQFHGTWEIRTHENNHVAQIFWRKLISEYTNECFHEAEKGSGNWSGPIWTFEN